MIETVMPLTGIYTGYTTEVGYSHYYLRCEDRAANRDLAFPPHLFTNKMTVYEELVRLYSMAQGFGDNELSKQCLVRLRHHLKASSSSVQKAFHKADNKKQQNINTEIEPLMNGIRLAYGVGGPGYRWLQESFRPFLKMCHFWPLLDETFFAAAKAIPQFWTDAHDDMHSAIRNKEFPGWEEPLGCMKCATIPWCEESFYWGEVSIDRGVVYGTCGKCSASVLHNGNLGLDSLNMASGGPGMASTILASGSMVHTGTTNGAPNVPATNPVNGNPGTATMGAASISPGVPEANMNTANIASSMAPINLESGNPAAGNMTAANVILGLPVPAMYAGYANNLVDLGTNGNPGVPNLGTANGNPGQGPMDYTTAPHPLNTCPTTGNSLQWPTTSYTNDRFWGPNLAEFDPDMVPNPTYPAYTFSGLPGTTPFAEAVRSPKRRRCGSVQPRPQLTNSSRSVRRAGTINGNPLGHLILNTANGNLGNGSLSFGSSIAPNGNSLGAFDTANGNLNNGNLGFGSSIALNGNPPSILNAVNGNQNNDYPDFGSSITPNISLENGSFGLDTSNPPNANPLGIPNTATGNLDDGNLYYDNFGFDSFIAPNMNLENGSSGLGASNPPNVNQEDGSAGLGTFNGIIVPNVVLENDGPGNGVLDAEGGSSDDEIFRALENSDGTIDLSPVMEWLDS
jgi:hypothetical protein